MLGVDFTRGFQALVGLKVDLADVGSSKYDSLREINDRWPKGKKYQHGASC